jgi:hypothetical protein
LAITCIFTAAELPGTNFLRKHEYLVLCTVFVSVFGLAHLGLAALNYRMDGHVKAGIGNMVEPFR